MSQINIFKISQNKKEMFRENLEKSQGVLGKKVNINDWYLFFYNGNQRRKYVLQWEWAIPENSFDDKIIEESSNLVYKGILCLEKNSNLYAVTFGNAFYMVDKYSDKNFAFDFARKFNYETIKSTSQITPNSNKNKVINSYIKNDFFDYESGEAFIKIKALIKFEKDFSLFKKNIEIGTSIKLNVPNPNITKLLEIMDYIEDKLEEDDLTKIPLFNQVKDEALLEKLEKELATHILEQDITFSDFDIIGTNEIFYSQATQYRIAYGHKRKDVDFISMNEIKQFCKENNLSLSEIYDELNIMFIDQNNIGEKYKLRQIVDMSVEEEKCVLVNGEWFQYNDDYLESLKASLNELDCVYDSNFDWDQSEYEQYIDEKLVEYNSKREVKDKFSRQSIQKKFYPELVLNKIMEKKFGYRCNDRNLTYFGNTEKLELNDLYKDDSIYAVKIGATSSKLSYTVNQMSTAMKVIRKEIQEDDFYKNIKNVILVLILERKKPLSIDENNRININDLNMLVLKNSLDVWQKEAIRLKFHPKVIIAYKNTNENELTDNCNDTCYKGENKE